MKDLDMSYYCPELFTGELLYSWVSRWTHDSPLPSKAIILASLLGTRNKQLDSTFPSFISKLSNVSGYVINDLIYLHTTIPYFQSFCDETVFAQMIESIEQGCPNNAFTKLSLIAGRVSEGDSLHYCPMCVEGDIERFGISFWHVDHQLPGVSVCVEHKIQLCSMKKSRRAMIKPPQRIDGDNVVLACQLALDLASLSKSLLEINYVFSGEKLAFIYKLKLAELGMTSNRYQLHQVEFKKALIQYWAPIMPNASIQQIFELGNGSTYPSCLFYKAKANHHPLKHILVIGMLFRSFEEFVTEYQMTDFMSMPIRQQTKACTDKQDKIARQSRIAITLLRKGRSLRQAAKRTGLSVLKVKQVAIIHGIEIKRRTQKIFAKERRAIWRKLCTGLPTEEIAQEFDCSQAAVEQILGQHPELKALRKVLRFSKVRKQHREGLIKALNPKDNNTRGAIQKAARASYTWLFKHDKEWLYQHLPSEIPRRLRPRKKKGKSQ